MQTSASADGSGKFPFTERIISGSNLFILTDANGNLTGSTSIPGGSFTNLTVTGALTASIISASNSITAAAATFAGPVTMSSTLSASGGIITSTISASSNVYVSGSLTVIGNIVGTIDSASAILITDTPTTAGTYYVTFVDGTTGVRSLRTDSSTLTWNPSTNTLSSSGNLYVGGGTVDGPNGTVNLFASATSINIGSSPNDPLTTFFGDIKLDTGLIKGSDASSGLQIQSYGIQVYGNSISSSAGTPNIILNTNQDITSSRNLRIAGTTQATDWNNGALTVVGGVGIGKNLYVSGSLNAIGVISASAGLTASAIQDAGTLTVVGNSILSNVFATNITASNISASGFVSASAIFDTGTLTVVGNSILSNVFATNITASNISASGFVSASAIFDTGTLTVIGNSTLSNVFATNITASNISASGNISASTLRVETSIVDGGTLTVLGSTVLGDTTADTTRITGSTSISGSLTVVGNTTLQSTFVTNLTASNISASGFISGSDGIFAGDVAVNGGDITTTSATATLFNTNASNVNIGGGAVTQVLLGSAIGIVKTAGDFRLGANNIIQDTSGATGLTVTNTVTTVAGDLKVVGNDIQDSSGTNNLTLSSTRVNVPLTLQPTDWTNGALTVAGGVGIGKNLHVSGSTFLYGDLTIFGTGSIVNISSSTVIIGDNRIQLNAGVPIQRYAGIDVFDSGSGTFTNNVTSSLLWDGLNDYWVLVSANSSSGAPLTQSSAIMIGGPTGSFGGESLLTVNYIPKVQSSGRNLQNSSLSDNGTTLSYAGTGISASQVTSSQLTVQYTGSITYATGVYITYTTGSFTTITITTGSNPGLGAQVPSSPTANGLAGQINVDNNFIYVYTNQVWKRVPLSTWTA
jgi:hypothetical protein